MRDYEEDGLVEIDLFELLDQVEQLEAEVQYLRSELKEIKKFYADRNEERAEFRKELSKKFQALVDKSEEVNHE